MAAIAGVAPIPQGTKSTSYNYRMQLRLLLSISVNKLYIQYQLPLFATA